MKQKQIPPWVEISVLVLILLVAAGLRFYQLDQIPPGLTHDEADVGYFVLARYHGERVNIQAPYGYANEPFTQVSGALLMRLLGPSDITLRVHQALYGMLLVLLTYLWTRIALDSSTGLLAAGLIATGFWPVFASRQALNTQPLPVLLVLAATSLWMALYHAGHTRSSHPLSSSVHGEEKETGHPVSHAPGGWRKWAWYIVFALALGASFYVYEASRVAWLVFPAYGVYLFFADRNRLLKDGLAWGIALAMGGLLGLPHLLNPLAWGRTGTHIGALSANLGELTRNILEGLGTIFVRGDPFVTYNQPGRPILVAPLAVAFLLGVAVIVWRRQPGGVFALLWLGAALIPTMMLGAYTSGLHSTAAQSPVFIIPAIGWTAAGRWLVGRFGERWTGFFVVLTAIGVALLGVETAHTYFNVWGRSTEARSAYFHTMSEMTAHIQQAEHSDMVIASGPFPSPPLDPFIGLLRVRREDIDLRWTDVRTAVPLADALLYSSADTPLDPFLGNYLALTPVEHVELEPTDTNPYYDIYRLDLEETFEALQADFTAPLEGEAVFGDAVELLGYTIQRTSEALTVGTVWLVRNPAALGPVPVTDYQHDVAIFVQALDQTEQVIAQQDTIGFPWASWVAGDLFLHVHRLSLPDELPDGNVALLIGMYTRPGIAHLPLTLDGEDEGNALRLVISLDEE